LGQPDRAIVQAKLDAVLPIVGLVEEEFPGILGIIIGWDKARHQKSSS
jgi:hypothetical protein